MCVFELCECIEAVFLTQQAAMKVCMPMCVCVRERVCVFELCECIEAVFLTQQAAMKVCIYMYVCVCMRTIVRGRLCILCVICM